jgi:phosphate transport system substrate-binding protein
MLVSESHLPLLKQEAAEFMAVYDKTDVRMVGTTARGAIVALLNDSVHCICVDRQLNTEERKVAQDAGMNIATVRIGRDAIVFVVNEHNPLKTISMKTLGGILDGSITKWSKVPGARLFGQLELVMTGKNSGIYEMLQQRFFKLTKELALAKVGESERQIAQYVATSEKALGAVSLAAVVDRPRGIHLLSVEITDTTGKAQSVPPNQENVYDELYPLHYSLYLYISEEKLGVGSGFSTFVMTLPGQKIIQDYGLAPEIVPSRIIQLKSE